MAKISVAPVGHILRSLRSQRIAFWMLLAELVDNSLDAGATTIHLDYRGNRLTISDNGRGTSRPQALATLGEHRSHSSTILGRYGIGAKDALLALGTEQSTCRVETVNAGNWRGFEWRWIDIAKSWEAEEPTVRPSTDGELGTKITVWPLDRDPNSKQRESVIRELGYIYSPAIKKGCQITIRWKGARGTPEPIPRWEWPALDGELVDTTIDVAGKVARVRCGVIHRDVKERRYGLHYVHGPRVILGGTAKGCGAYSPTRVCGVVELDGSWALAKNKDAIVAHADELYAAVEEAIRPVLIRAEQQGMAMHSRAFEDAVSGMLNAALLNANAKAKRDRGDKRGTRQPNGRGGRHKRARKEQDGNTFPARGYAGSVRVHHERLGEDAGIGEVKWPNIVMNMDSPFVATVYASQNVEATYALAAGLLSSFHSLEEPDGQMRLRNVIRTNNTMADYSAAMDAILKGSPSAATDAAE